MNRDDPNSLTGFLDRSFLHGAGLDPNGCTSSRPKRTISTPQPLRTRRNSAALGGLDLVILGLGPNGHIAYNEPGRRPTPGRVFSP